MGRGGGRDVLEGGRGRGGLKGERGGFGWDPPPPPRVPLWSPPKVHGELRRGPLTVARAHQRGLHRQSVDGKRMTVDRVAPGNRSFPPSNPTNVHRMPQAVSTWSMSFSPTRSPGAVPRAATSRPHAGSRSPCHGSALAA